jgi:probable phosphoglycerate mutase
MDLIVIRHGLPHRDETTSDPPLTDTGHEQARRAAAWIADERIDAVYSSPMKRAVETAEAFTALTGQEIQLDEGIVEFDRGTGQYVPMEELKRTDYEAWLRFVHGGYNMDIHAFQHAVVTSMEAIVAANKGKRVAVFCHGGVINVWTAHVLGMEARLFFEPVYTSLHRYLCASSGQRNIVSLNETAHLRDMAPTHA